MSALQIRSDSMAEWEVLRDQAAILLNSDFLPQAIKTPEQALAIILTGRELGVGPMAALQTINVIQGKPTVSPQLMLALVNRTGQVEDIQIVATKDGATCTIKRVGRSPYTARFGPTEAAAMGLLGKDNYKKQPATMYKWRAVADACRATFADVILGVYTPDEMGAVTEPESGEILNIVQEKSHIESSHPVEFPQDLPPEPIVAEVEETTSKRTEESRKKHHPVKAAALERRHSPETARRFDAVVQRLVIHGVDGGELLRETNCALHDSGRPQVKTRYELDEESVAVVIGLFEEWADTLDRKAGK